MFESQQVYVVPEVRPKSRCICVAACWSPLFSMKVVSRGAVPHRPETMKGLEIDYAVLIAVSGVDLPAIEEDGIYFDGYQTALYPMHKDLTSNYFQWHLDITNPSQAEPASTDSLTSEWTSAKSDFKWYRTRNLDNLTGTKRHFGGWCTAAVSTLGTTMQEGGKLRWSESRTCRREVDKKQPKTFLRAI